MFDEIMGPPESLAGYNAGGGDSSWLGAITGLATTATKAYADVKTTDARARMMTQYSPWGGYYQEGMPAGRYAPTISPLLLLLIGGALLFALKD